MSALPPNAAPLPWIAYLHATDSEGRARPVALYQSADRSGGRGVLDVGPRPADARVEILEDRPELAPPMVRLRVLAGPCRGAQGWVLRDLLPGID